MRNEIAGKEPVKEREKVDNSATASAVMSGKRRVKLKASFFHKPWSRLDSYIFSEIHRPFLMAMMVYNGIFFIRTLAKLTELSEGMFEIPFTLFVFFFLSEIPEIFYVTVSLSFLFAAIAAMSRMSGDSEILAPQSLGLSFWRLSKPVIAYGFLLSAGLFVLTNWLGPKLNQVWQYKYADFMENVAIPSIQAGAVNQFGKGTMLYLDRVDQDRLADLVFINQSDDKEEILLADHASIYDTRELELFDAVKVDFPSAPEKGPEVLRAKRLEQSIPLPTDLGSSKMRGTDRDSLNTFQLIHFRDTDAEPWEQREANNEILERLVGPWICLIFSLFAVPMAAKHSRLSKSSGFGLSLVVFAVYFLVGKMSRDAGEQGDIPLWLGYAGPSILFLFIGILAQAGKHFWWSRYTHKFFDRIGGVKSRVSGRVTKKIKEIGKKARNGRGNTDGRAASHTFVFPSKLDVYVVRSFMSIFLLVQCSILVLFALIEYTQIAKHAQKNDIEPSVIIRYLLYKFPEMVDMTMFICLLIATLILFAVMSKNQEVTAVRAGGGSLQRLCLPLLFVGALASAASYTMENSFVPHTNGIALSLRNQIKKSREINYLRDVWIKSSPGEIVNFQYFDPRAGRLHQVTRYLTDTKNEVKLVRESFKSLVYTDRWIVEEPAERWAFSGAKEGGKITLDLDKIQPGTGITLNLERDDLTRKRRRPGEYSIKELRDYLHYIRQLGIVESGFQAELYAKYAQPLLPFFMMLLAMPLGFQFGRRGTFYGIGMGLVAGLIFWGLFELFKQLGASGVIHPLVGGLGIISFVGLFAIYRFVQLE